MAPKKGQPQAKPTREELQERVEFTAKAMSRRLYKSDIKRLLMQRYNVDHRTCENYIARARALLIEETSKPREEHRIDSLAFWENIIRSDADLAYRMRAQERIEKLLGLEAPSEVILHGGGGGGANGNRPEPEKMSDRDMALELSGHRTGTGDSDNGSDDREAASTTPGDAAPEPGP